MNDKRTKVIAGVGLLTAVVFILQFLGGFIKFGPFSISLVLIPIVVGAALYGVASGAWLGLAFAVAVFATGDANLFFVFNPIGTIITVCGKGIIAGALTSVVYKAIVKKNENIGLYVSAVCCPILNTGVFLICCRIFFMGLMEQWADAMGFGDNVLGYMIFGMVGINFVAELAVNMLLSPIIVRLVRFGKKRG